MEIKQDCPTDERVNGAGVRLKAEPLCAANPTLLPKVNPFKKELSSLAKKILPERKNKGFDLGTKHDSPQINLSDKKPSTYLKRRKYREMKKTVFGYELVLDLSGCDLAVMSSKTKLAEYVDRLCKLIKMKKFGKVQLPYFGLEKPQTKGYSMLQFIETSSITGHFSEYWRKSYINVFSCKTYDHRLATEFTKNFFKAKKVKARLLVR